MTREEKNEIINQLAEKIKQTTNYYLTDISELNAADTTKLRRLCYSKEINLVVVKNTLLKKAFEKADASNEEINNVLSGPTSVMFCEVGNVPAKLIKEYRKKQKKKKPLLKAAYVEESVYIGEEQLETLVNIKSKDELIADVVALLQSPLKNVVSSLQSGGNTLTGILKTLSEKEQQEA